MLLDKGPVDRDAKTRHVIQMDHTVMHGWALCIQTVLDRMTVRVPVRFHPKGTGAERGSDVAMNMGSSMGCNGHPMLFCQRGDA